jgi:hypothetical protein
VLAREGGRAMCPCLPLHAESSPSMQRHNVKRNTRREKSNGADVHDTGVPSLPLRTRKGEALFYELRGACAHRINTREQGTT